MEREPIKADPDGLADVWRTAEQRRAEDIGAWLGHIFEQRCRLKVARAEGAYPEGHPALR